MSEPLGSTNPLNNPQCKAHSKRSGERCQKPAMNGTTVCRNHGGAAPQVKAKARVRLEEAADRMAKQLLGIAEGAESEAVKLAAVKHVLAVAGISEKHALELSAAQPLQPWEQLVEELAPMTRAESRAARGFPDPLALVPVSQRDAEVIGAEIVPDPPRRRPPWAEDASAEPGQGNGPAQPGTGLMTIEEANADIATRNRANNLHGTRISGIGH
jgi:hypothetical protein